MKIEVNKKICFIESDDIDDVKYVSSNKDYSTLKERTRLEIRLIMLRSIMFCSLFQKRRSGTEC